MGGCWSCCRECLDLPPPINKDKVDLTHFDLHRVLGKGGFGKVQVVQSRLNGDYYALKSINKAWLVQSASNVQSVWLERHIMIQLRSPFLVPVYYAFQDAYYIYLVMHFMPGGDLHFLLQNKRMMAKGLRGARVMQSLPESHVQFYAAEVLLALEEMHSFGLVYRDLKPENVLLDAEGHVRLSDFGLAGDLNVEADAMTVGACGTTGYMAQELLANMRYDTTPDLFAFGVLIFEMLHGRVPEQEVDDPARLAFNPKLSEECVSLVRALLQPDPANRLGCDRHVSLGDRWLGVKGHAFFAGIDWDLAARRGLEPPFVPEADTANCDPIHELEEQLTESSPEERISAAEEAVFDGWDWHTEPEFHTRISNFSLLAQQQLNQGQASQSNSHSSGSATGHTPLAPGRALADGANGSANGGASASASPPREQVELIASARHARRGRSSSFEGAELRFSAPVMPASGGADPAGVGLQLTPLNNIHQNPSIDAFTHYYASSPSVVRSSDDEDGISSSGASPLSSPAPPSSHASPASPTRRGPSPTLDLGPSAAAAAAASASGNARSNIVHVHTGPSLRPGPSAAAARTPARKPSAASTASVDLDDVLGVQLHFDGEVDRDANAHTQQQQQQQQSRKQSFQQQQLPAHAEESDQLEWHSDQ